MTFLSRLNFNFDTTKFGDAVDPAGDLQKKLSTGPAILSTATGATYTVAVASNTAKSTYFQNPVGGLCGTLATRLTTIYNLLYSAHTTVQVTDPDTGAVSNVDTYFYRNGSLTDPYNLLIQELTTVDSNGSHNPLSFNTFISHTNRLSNLDYTNKSTRPDFNGGLRACETVQKLVHQNEKGLTSKATIEGLGLGCFTSLFIAVDITNHYTTLGNIQSTANTLFATEPVASQTIAMDNCYNSFLTEMSAILTLIQGRRQADENFYVAACAILQDVNSVNQLVNSVSTASFASPQQSFLINNYLGTASYDQLKP